MHSLRPPETSAERVPLVAQWAAWRTELVLGCQLPLSPATSGPGHWNHACRGCGGRDGTHAREHDTNFSSSLDLTGYLHCSVSNMPTAEATVSPHRASIPWLAPLVGYVGDKLLLDPFSHRGHSY